MRIIAGTLKGRRLHTPEAGETVIRPTSDKAREALFSILQRWPEGPFLDLFAGTGAVGLEAWSRGFDPVTCVENHPKALGLVIENLKGSGVHLLKRDVRRFNESSFRDLAVLFCDPPYAQSGDLWASLAPRMRPWMAPEGVLVWEGPDKTELSALSGWAKVDSRRYGAARFHFFEPV